MKTFKELVKGFGQRNVMVETVSCCGGGGGGHTHHQHDNNSQSNADTIYQCPMKCEGDKTYSKPGDCPVCNMHLASVN